MLFHWALWRVVGVVRSVDVWSLVYIDRVLAMVPLTYFKGNICLSKYIKTMFSLRQKALAAYESSLVQCVDEVSTNNVLASIPYSFLHKKKQGTKPYFYELLQYHISLNTWNNYCINTVE